MSIQKIHARQIFDSRGNPTVEVDLHTAKGMFRAAVPSGASTGVHEAVELRDNDKSNYMGKGVLKAVKNVNDIIAPALIKANHSVIEQAKIDELMIKLDGTPNKGKLYASCLHLDIKCSSSNLFTFVFRQTWCQCHSWCFLGRLQSRRCWKGNFFNLIFLLACIKCYLIEINFL